jgi:hypothetical protein
VPKMTPPPEAISARAKLHHAVRRHFSSAIARHYKEHPEWMDDERGRKKISMMLGVMHEVLNEIDRYRIEDAPNEIDMKWVT